MAFTPQSEGEARGRRALEILPASRGVGTGPPQLPAQDSGSLAAGPQLSPSSENLGGEGLHQAQVPDSAPTEPDPEPLRDAEPLPRRRQAGRPPWTCLPWQHDLGSCSLLGHHELFCNSWARTLALPPSSGALETPWSAGGRQPMAHIPQELPAPQAGKQGHPHSPGQAVGEQQPLQGIHGLCPSRGQWAGVMILPRLWPLPEASSEGVSGSPAWSLGHRPQADSPGRPRPSSSSVALVMLPNSRLRTRGGSLSSVRRISTRGAADWKSP